MWENLDMAVKFSGMPDERGFIMLHVDINQYSPELIEGVLGTLEKIDENKTKSKTKTAKKATAKKSSAKKTSKK